MRLLFLAIGSLMSFNAEARDVIKGPIEADVTRVIDGDTIEVSAKIWPDQRVSTKVRLNGVDTPDKANC